MTPIRHDGFYFDVDEGGALRWRRPRYGPFEELDFITLPLPIHSIHSTLSGLVLDTVGGLYLLRGGDPTTWVVLHIHSRV